MATRSSRDHVPERRRRRRRCGLLADPLLGLLLAGPAATDPGDVDLVALTLEQLMGLEVTLASRGEGRLFETAAAAFVLTGDDLIRAGVTSLPEALRLVPGMQVGHIDASKWAVSARGFSDRFAQKLLVLIDGRNVYSPLFGGVFWEAHDVPLEDVDRIEVIRGPGATLWGANAVNGIVNVVTRPIDPAGGGVVRFAAGTEERAAASVGYAGALGATARYRVYGRDAFADASGRKAHDDWDMGRGGLRAEWSPSPRDELIACRPPTPASATTTHTTARSGTPGTWTSSTAPPTAGTTSSGGWGGSSPATTPTAAPRSPSTRPAARPTCPAPSPRTTSPWPATGCT